MHYYAMLYSGVLANRAFPCLQPLSLQGRCPIVYHTRIIDLYNTSKIFRFITMSWLYVNFTTCPLMLIVPAYICLTSAVVPLSAWNSTRTPPGPTSSPPGENRFAYGVPVCNNGAFGAVCFVYGPPELDRDACERAQLLCDRMTSAINLPTLEADRHLTIPFLFHHVHGHRQPTSQQTQRRGYDSCNSCGGPGTSLLFPQHRWLRLLKLTGDVRKTRMAVPRRARSHGRRISLS